MKGYVEGLIKLVFDLCSITILYSCIDDEWRHCTVSLWQLLTDPYIAIKVCLTELNVFSKY